MPRRLISLLIALYAIAFAFGAMAAIRWPSVMLFLTFVLGVEPVESMAHVDWRQLGLAYGAPYFLAALCLYAASITLSRRGRGSIFWYVSGCVAGFPCVFLVDFDPEWWRDPSIGEGAVTGAALSAVLLGIAVWLLRRRDKKQAPRQKPEPRQNMQAQQTLQQVETEPAPPSLDTPPQPVQPIIVQAAPPRPAVKPRRKPVPAAIARQRAHFAAEGRRMLARQKRR